MKEQYEEVRIEVIEFRSDSEDILVTSPYYDPNSPVLTPEVPL